MWTWREQSWNAPPPSALTVAGFLDVLLCKKELAEAFLEFAIKEGFPQDTSPQPHPSAPACCCQEANSEPFLPKEGLQPGLVTDTSAAIASPPPLVPPPLVLARHLGQGTVDILKKFAGNEAHSEHAKLFGVPGASKRKDMMWLVVDHEQSGARLLRLVASTVFSTEWDTSIRFWLRAGKRRPSELLKDTLQLRSRAT